jgi:hypothetical protein
MPRAASTFRASLDIGGTDRAADRAPPQAERLTRALAAATLPRTAATVLGWHKRRVTARRRILELPGSAQQLVGAGEIPVVGIEALLEIQVVSPQLAARCPR